MNNYILGEVICILYVNAITNNIFFARGTKVHSDLCQELDIIMELNGTIFKLKTYYRNLNLVTYLNFQQRMRTPEDKSMKIMQSEDRKK